MIGRELRLAVRRRSTYYNRVSAAVLVSLTTLALVYAGYGGWMGPAVAGRNLFLVLSLLGFVYVLFDGVLRTADSISDEKREGTLPLLFLTDLKSGDIILGKLSSRILPTACNVIAGLPALGFSIFLGGITGPDVFRMILALLNALFYASAFGMLISVLCRSDRTAFVAGFLGVVVLGIGLPAIGLVVQLRTGGTEVNPVFLGVSPGGAIWEIVGWTQSAPGPDRFVSAIGTAHLIAWGFLIGAAFLLRFTWRESTQVLAFLWREVRLGRKSFGGSPARERARWLDAHPLIWAGERNRVAAWSWMIVVGCVAAAVVIVWWFDIVLLSGWQALVGISVLLHFLVAGVVLIQACRAPVQHRRSGVFEILCTTPLGPDLVVEGGQLAFKRQCLGPVSVVLIVDCLIVAYGWWNLSFGLALAWTGLILLLAAKWILDLYVISWVGFWQGLRSGTATGAIRRTVAYVYVWRWLILLLFMAMAGGVSGFRSGTVVPGILAGTAYCGITAAVYLHFVALARSDLKDSFRILAARQQDMTEVRGMGLRARIREWFREWLWWIGRRASHDAVR